MTSRASATRLRAALLLLVLAAPGCFLWPQPRGTDDHPTVTGFDIEGTKAVSAKELRQALATQPSGRRWFIIPDPARFDLDAFDNDKKRIVRFYQARGYYHATVEQAEVLPDGPGKVKVRIRVDEGPPVKVTEVILDGIDAAPEAKQRLGKLPLGPGSVFTEKAFDATREAILAALQSTGWAKAEVAQHAQVDPLLNEAHVTYTITPGERYRFGSVFVAGAAKIPRARIRAEAESEVQPGAVYDATELPKAQARVFDLGVFGGVRVTPAAPDEAKKEIPVTVSVREAPFRTIRVGPGFTLQLTRWELDAFAGWSHRNWLGGLRKLNLDARIGYAWVPSLLDNQKSGWVGLTSADFTQPAVFTRHLDFNIRTEVERGLEQAYDFWAERVRFGFPIKFGRLVTFTPSVNAELYELSAQPTVTNSQTGQSLQLVTCPGRNPNLCLLSYFEQRIALDLRDDPINTKKGLYVALSVQEGFSFKGNGATYMRFLPEARGFMSLPLDIVLAARARVGIVDAPNPDDIPIVARFTSGGPNLMRGYYNRRLSPVVSVQVCSDLDRLKNRGACPPGVATEYVPVGGRGLVEGSLELRFPISGAVGGAVFVDFGNVRNSVADALKVEDLQYALGAGLRYKTIFGPLRVDVAARLPGPEGQPGIEVLTQTSTGTGRTVLTPTGQYHHEPIVSLQISVGEAF